jgi:hypothetical protein
MANADLALFSAIHELQQLRDTYIKRGDYYRAQAADDAISLALSPKREVTKHLGYECFRNAKHLLQRAKKKHEGLPEGDTKFSLGKNAGAFTDASAQPDSLLAFNELQHFVTVVATNAHPRFGVKVLADLLADEPTVNTAAVLGCSSRTVKHVRAAIRQGVKRLVA